MLTLLLSLLTVGGMIAAVLFFPKWKIGKREIDTYPFVTLTGAFLLLAFHRVTVGDLAAAFGADTAVNPVKILVLFLSMTVMSVYLDEAGFFRYLAAATLRRAGADQKKLFFLLYAAVSVLTVFTSNDIIILSFTPFICYFAKSAKIDPIPYLAAEFVAANTWSMALIIGNPTNIYIASSMGVDFVSYLCVMWLPTLFAGTAALFCLYLLFRRKLQKPLVGEAENTKIDNKTSLFTGIIHLGCATVCLAVGPYLGFDMWLVAFGFLLSLVVFSLVLSARGTGKTLRAALGRTPVSLVPFLLSMFTLVLALGHEGVTAALARALCGVNPVLSFGASSFLFANVVNNIPMSVFYSDALAGLSSASRAGALYATVVGSNLGAFLTPIGALAGIMFRGILADHGIRFGYGDFLRIGVVAALPALAAALGGLLLVL